ncbi:MAG: HlyD family secretion protein [Verrucomicrobia bacterium]|nr:HlyD family secretion protein [Verrucomicrobiota bacterium]
MAEFHGDEHTFQAWKVQLKKYERRGGLMVSWGMTFTHVPLRTPLLFRWLAAMWLVAGLSIAGIHRWRESRCWVVTDNAYLDGPVHPLAARLLGTVTEVLVEEHRRVKQGEILIRLDPRDAQTRRDQSEAKLSETRAALAAAETGVTHTQDNTLLNDIALDKARLDLARMQGLTCGTRTSVARQDLDHAQAAYDTAGASVVASRSAVEVAKAEMVVARAKESAAAAALQEAILQCEYTTIRSPVDGRVGRRNVEPGQPVIPAQPLIALVGDDLWLTANFKETQIASINVGQAALIRFDAFPGREWPGTVESLSPASGARFALLPPDNATGNFTRVVQRLPVRIRIHQAALRELGPRLAPGLSAKVRVRVGAASPIETAAPMPANLTNR